MAQYCESKGVSRARLLFEGLNEPQLWANEPPDLTARYYQAFLSGLHGYGLHGVVGNFGVAGRATEAWRARRRYGVSSKPVIDIMQPPTSAGQAGDYLGLHEYWAPQWPTAELALVGRTFSPVSL